MRPGVDQDLFRRALLDQDLQHVPHVASFVGPCVELAVRESSRAALAEAVVAVRVHQAVLVEQLEISAARLDLLAAFDDRRADAMPRQFVGAEHPGGTIAHDDDRRPSSLTKRKWCLFLVLAVAQFKGVMEADATPARIQRALAQLGSW